MLYFFFISQQKCVTNDVTDVCAFSGTARSRESHAEVEVVMAEEVEGADTVAGVAGAQWSATTATK